MPGEIPGPQVIDFTVPIPTVLTREGIASQLGPYTIPENLPQLDACAFRDKKVLITGSGRGIGRATALRFAQHGASVVVNSRAESWEQGLGTVEEIIEMGGSATYLPGDVSDIDDVTAIFKEAGNLLGGLDIVVNNAGIRIDDLVLRMKDESFSRVVATNLGGQFNVLKSALKMMGKGRIKFIDNSSVAALGSPGQTPYASSKAAGEILGLSAAIEMAGFNRPFDLGIFRIALVDTDLTSDLNEKQRQTLIDLFPSRRVFTPEDAAIGITYLASLPESENAHRLTFA